MKKLIIPALLMIGVAGLAVGFQVSAQETVVSEASESAQQQARLSEEIEQLNEIYRGQLLEYRQAEKQFEIDRDQYEQLETLAAITKVTESAKEAMRLRAQVMLTYFELMRVSLIAAENIDLTLETAVLQRVSAQQNWLNTHQEALSAATQREEFNQLADTFIARKPEFEEVYREANSLFLLGELQSVHNELIAVADDMTVAATESGKVSPQAFRETERAVDAVATELDELWGNLTTAIAERDTSSFYQRLAADTEATYSGLNKVISFLKELLRQL